MTFRSGRRVWVLDKVKREIYPVSYNWPTIDKQHDVVSRCYSQLRVRNVYPTFRAACRAVARKQG